MPSKPTFNIVSKCEVCGKPFEVKRPSQRLCSRQCSRRKLGSRVSGAPPIKGTE